MRHHTCSNLFVLAISMLLAGGSVAQPPERSRGSEGARRSGPTSDMLMRAMPVLAVLDANQDGVISKEEINNATMALKTLDKNNDGELSEQEMRPDFSAMRGRGGPSERSGRGGFGRSPEGSRPEGSRPEGSRGGVRPDGGSTMVDRAMQMDQNGDGKLSRDEVSERFLPLFDRADQDRDGFATKDELGAIASGPSRDAGNGRSIAGEGQERDRSGFFSRIFEQRDTNKDGKLSRDEMPEQMAGRLEQFDTDKDGSVSRSEMEAMMSRMGNRGGMQNRRPARGGNGDQPGASRAGGELPQRPTSE